MDSKPPATPYDYRQRAWEYVRVADYDRAFASIRAALKFWPDDLMVNATYASILGDYGEQQSRSSCRKAKAEVCSILRCLMLRLKGVPPVSAKYIRNAYVHYALALGINGENAKMEAALLKSGEICGKPQSYKEFAEVRKIISEYVS